MCWSAIVGLDYCLDTKKLQEWEENENLFVYQENIRIEKKKNRVDKIKKKFCLVKKIVRKLNEKGIGREKKNNFESQCGLFLSCMYWCGQCFWQAAYYLILNLSIVQTICPASIFR